MKKKSREYQTWQKIRRYFFRWKDLPNSQLAIRLNKNLTITFGNYLFEGLNIFGHIFLIFSARLFRWARLRSATISLAT